MRGGSLVRHRMSGRRNTANGQVGKAAKATKARLGEVAGATSADGGL